MLDGKTVAVVVPAFDEEDLIGTTIAGIPELVDRMYFDTPEELQEMAGRQVHAHLLKLRAEGKVAGRDVKSAWKTA